jgi:hypothetical protein
MTQVCEAIHTGFRRTALWNLRVGHPQLEASMRGPLDKQPQETHGVYRNSNIKLIALPILFVVALLGFAVSHPDVSRWISEAVQAEFVGPDIDSGRSSVRRFAKPANEVPTVKVH